MSRTTTEYCTLIKATSQLTRAVKNDLVPLSVELVASQLITVDKGEELRNRNVDVMDRAAKLVTLVTNKVELDKKNYYSFIRILRNRRITYEEVLEVLEPVYFAGGHVYNKGAPAAPTIDQPWYHRQLSREEAEQRLGEMEDDSFLVRASTTQKHAQVGKLILSVKNGDTFYHFFIERGFGTYEIEGTNLPFSSPVELVDYYKKNGLPENDTGEVIFLSLPCTFTISSHDFPDSYSAATGSSQTISDNVSDSSQNTFIRGLRPRSSTYTSEEGYSYVLDQPQPGQTSSQPLDLLHRQKYFHGAISREEAETLLKRDGQFLVRESSRQPGQYVLSGRANGRPCHFLLTDSDGKVIFKDKSSGKDIEFDSIVNLVTYFTDTNSTLFHGGYQVTLIEPVNVYSFRYTQSYRHSSHKN